MHTNQSDIDIASSNDEHEVALKATFPASNPPAATSIMMPVYKTENSRAAEVFAYLAISKGMTDKNHSQWRTYAPCRWVSANANVIYASLSPAAAVLESIAKNDIANDPDQWILATLRFPANKLMRLDSPIETWRERPYRAEVRAFGDQWALEQQSLALRVPSAICPYEYNVLINTNHSDFENVFVEDFMPLEYDLRLTR